LNLETLLFAVFRLQNVTRRFLTQASFFDNGVSVPDHILALQWVLNDGHMDAIEDAEVPDREFHDPSGIGLMPIPLATLVAFAAVYWVLQRRNVALAGYAWIVLAGTALICVMAGLGLAYSLYPYIVLDRLTIWEAAAAPSSLKFVFVGVAIVLPFTIAYTIFVYRIFHGKATGLSYGEQD